MIKSKIYKIEKNTQNKIDSEIRRILTQYDISHVEAVKIILQVNGFLISYLCREAKLDLKFLIEYLEKIDKSLSTRLALCIDINVRLEEIVERECNPL